MCNLTEKITIDFVLWYYLSRENEKKKNNNEFRRGKNIKFIVGSRRLSWRGYPICNVSRLFTKVHVSVWTERYNGVLGKNKLTNLRPRPGGRSTYGVLSCVPPKVARGKIINEYRNKNNHWV